jgi:hypothetical protein
MTAIAVCHFIFGILNLLIGLFLIILATANLGKQFQSDADQHGWMACLAMGLVQLPIAGFLITAAIGVLRVSSWGRTFSLVFAWVMIGGAGIIAALHLRQTFIAASLGYSLGFGEAVNMAVLSIIRGTISVVMFAAYPVILLIAFSRPTWKHAFAKRREGVAQ